MTVHILDEVTITDSAKGNLIFPSSLPAKTEYRTCKSH